jgi:hypothetical protein
VKAFGKTGLALEKKGRNLSGGKKHRPSVRRKKNRLISPCPGQGVKEGPGSGKISFFQEADKSGKKKCRLRMKTGGKGVDGRLLLRPVDLISQDKKTKGKSQKQP